MTKTTAMNQAQAKRLGTLLRKRRREMDLSFRDVAEASGVHHTTILRLEAGENLTPSADKLARVAQALELQVAEIYALAGFAAPDQLLPNPTLYLRTKYRNLSDRRLTAITKDVEAILKRHGIDPEHSLGQISKRTRKGGKP